jgi:hypothetical protein
VLDEHLFWARRSSEHEQEIDRRGEGGMNSGESRWLRQSAGDEYLVAIFGVESCNVIVTLVNT